MVYVVLTCLPPRPASHSPSSADPLHPTAVDSTQSELAVAQSSVYRSCFRRRIHIQRGLQHTHCTGFTVRILRLTSAASLAFSSAKPTPSSPPPTLPTPPQEEATPLCLPIPPPPPPPPPPHDAAGAWLLLFPAAIGGPAPPHEAEGATPPEAKLLWEGDRNRSNRPDTARGRGGGGRKGINATQSEMRA